MSMLELDKFKVYVVERCWLFCCPLFLSLR